MQYVGQTCRFLKTRFSEHYRRTKKPRKIDNFLYRHFKQTNHSTSSISIQPVEKIIYGDNSTKRYRNILRHELELKWIKLLQTPHPLGFNDNIYHEGNISRLPDFDVFSLLDIRKRNNRSHGKRKNGNLKRKNKHVLTLSELSIVLKHSGRHMALSRLVTISISSLRNLDIEANKFYDRTHRLYDAVSIDFKSCREEIAGALQEFCNCWCKREHVESNALNSWKLNIFKIIDGRISFYCNNLDLLPPKPKFTFRHLKKGIQEFHRKFVLAPADKAANNVVVV